MEKITKEKVAWQRLRRDPWWQDQTGGSSHESTRLVSRAAQIEPMVIPAINNTTREMRRINRPPGVNPRNLTKSRHFRPPAMLRKSPSSPAAELYSADPPPRSPCLHRGCGLPPPPTSTSHLLGSCHARIASRRRQYNDPARPGRSLHNTLPHHPCRQGGGVAGDAAAAGEKGGRAVWFSEEMWGAR
jgi:hypothetical protein